MRWLYRIIVFLIAIVIFVAQNREIVMSFLRFGLHAPLALLTATVYVLGAIPGGSAFALPRKAIREPG